MRIDPTDRVVPAPQTGGTRALWDRLSDPARARQPWIEWPDRTLSYGAAARQVSRCCGMFDDLGLAPGDRVLIGLGDEGLATTLFVAALLDGCVPVMLGPDLPQPRARGIAALTEPKLAVLEAGEDAPGWLPADTRLMRSGGAKPGILGRLGLVGRGTDGAMEAALNGATPRAPRGDNAADALAYILFTSGTTSAPKGVQITHSNLAAMLEVIARVHRLDASSRVFNALALIHADGLIRGPLLALSCGAVLIRAAPFRMQELEDQLNMVRARRITHVQAVPTIWGYIDRYAEHDDYFDSPECVALMSSAAWLDPALADRLRARFGKPVISVYGLTETVCDALYAGDWPDCGTPGTLGLAHGCEVRLADPESGAKVQPGETGEIWIRGPIVSPGYYRAPDLTAARFAAGWLRTADLARLREDGSYDFMGRLSTRIMSGGHLIAPEEIDEALARHPAIAEAVTLALPDPDLEEIAVCAVVADQPVEEATLSAFLAPLLEAHKIPKRIVAVTAIPRGPAGKPDLEALRGQLQAAMGAEARVAASNADAEVIGIVARTLRVAPDTLGHADGPQSLPAWDSFAHINLILAIEQGLGLRIPTAEVMRIDSIGALIDAVERART